MKRVGYIVAAGVILTGMALVRHAPVKPARVAHAGSVALRARPAAVRAAPVVLAVASVPRPGPIPGDRLGPALLELTASDPAEAIEVLASLPDDDARHRFIAMVGAEVAPVDLEAAKELADALPRGLDRRFLVAGIVRLWSKTDPAGAATWLAPLPEGLERTQAMQILAAAWTLSDPTAARQWLESLPQGESREKAEEAVRVAQD